MGKIILLTVEREFFIIIARKPQTQQTGDECLALPLPNVCDIALASAQAPAFRPGLALLCFHDRNYGNATNNKLIVKIGQYRNA